ncbi:MAG: 1-acyl-sn-glycerol-3-phosphate acyltransferase [Bacteroidales bacterium]|nr:1-acyl-sn-glycerol-3-phosphate acyltransferase [Bacteroidales bacterium]
MILKLISRFILWIFGWKFIGGAPDAKKLVLAIAPHTSNLDVFLGKLASWIAGTKTQIIVKKEAFTFFQGPFIRMWGGVPLDRSDTGTVVEDIIKLFNEKDEFILAITPEGTRKKNPEWKTGFYRIAVGAKVPIYFAYIDFATKTMGMDKRFDPTGDFEKDIKEIKDFFKDMKGYHRDKFAT